MENQKLKIKAQRYKLKSKDFLFFICIFTFSFFIFNLPVNAQSSSSNNFNLEIQDLGNPEDQIIPNINQEITTNKPQTIITADPFSLSFGISEILTDFGELSPTTPVIRNLLLSVNAESSGYQVKVYKNNLLKSGNNIIPDTTCDNGTCSPLLAALWENNLTYGFGFRCDNVKGNACENEFEDNYYKQFADLSKRDRFQTELSSNLPIKNTQSKITMKLNIAGSVAPGTYTGNVTYIAVPNF